MSDKSSTLPSEKRLKERAKKLKKDQGIKQSLALDTVAQEYGFANWLEYKKSIES